MLKVGLKLCIYLLLFENKVKLYYITDIGRFVLKKKLILIICILFLLFLPLSYKYKIYKNKDINYVVEQHMTHGLFNKYKMHSITNLNLTFSDGNIAVVKVYGTSNSSPHKNISYNLFLTKSKNGAWKVKKIYENYKFSKENTSNIP